MAEAPTAGYNYTCNECGASFEVMEDLTKRHRQEMINSVQRQQQDQQVGRGIYS